MIKYLIYSIILFVIGQSLIWLQTNGQFAWEWFKKNPLLISFMGFPISYIFIKATQFSQQYFGNLWGGRMIGFSAGIFCFTILTWAIIGEPLNVKTLLTIILALMIILIQIFY